VGTDAQYGLLLKLGLVRLDQFSNRFLSRCVVGMKQLEHVRILPDDFTVGVAPLTRRT
jgi:hypothetical protein